MINPFIKRGVGAGGVIGFSLLSAAIATAVTYYLYGTRSGAKKRAKIAKMAREIKDDTVETAEGIADSAKRAISRRVGEDQ